MKMIQTVNKIKCALAVGLLSSIGAAAMQAEGKVDEAWELDGQPLEQLVSNCMAADGVYRHNRDSRMVYYPSCNKMSAFDGQDLIQTTSIDESCASTFETWMEAHWLTPKVRKLFTTDRNCIGDVCVIEMGDRQDDCDGVVDAYRQIILNIQAKNVISVDSRFGGNVTINTPPNTLPTQQEPKMNLPKTRPKTTEQRPTEQSSASRTLPFTFSISLQEMNTITTYRESPIARDTQAKLVEIYNGESNEHDFFGLTSFPIIASIGYWHLELFGTILPATFYKGEHNQRDYYYLRGNLEWSEIYNRTSWMVGVDATIPVIRGNSASLQAIVGTALDFSKTELQAKNWEDGNPPNYIFNENPITRKEKSTPHVRMGLEIESHKKTLGTYIGGGLIGDWSQRTINDLAGENYLFGSMPPHEDSMTWKNFDMSVYLKFNFRKG